MVKEKWGLYNYVKFKNKIKFKKNKIKNEIISGIFSDHNAVRLDVNYRKKKTIKNKTYGS